MVLQCIYSYRHEFTNTLGGDAAFVLFCGGLTVLTMQCHTFSFDDTSGSKKRARAADSEYCRDDKK